jgi:hypothetical protein
MRAALLALLPLAGCVEHRAEAVLPAPPPDAMTATILVAGRPASAPGVAVRRSAMPIDIPMDAVVRQADGSLARGSARVVTGTPWWQRFPFDLATDLTPWPQTVAASATATLAPVPSVTAADLAAAARSAGYARP